MLLLSEFFFFQCIGIRKLRGLARPLNVIESSYNFAGFISMSKRNIKSVGQSYLSTFNFFGTHYNCTMHMECDLKSDFVASATSKSISFAMYLCTRVCVCLCVYVCVFVC